MHIPMILTLAAGGFVGGYYGAAVGSAGLISLPLLILFGFTPSAAVASSRPAAFMLEVVAALRYRREGRLGNEHVRKGVILGAFASVGSVAGAFIVGAVSDQALRFLFAFVIVSMTAFVFLRKDWGTRQRRERDVYMPLLAFVTVFTGLYAGFFGFTFGTMMTIVLVWFGTTLVEAAALSRLIGMFTTLSATAVFLSRGSIDYTAAIALGIGYGVGAWFGAGAGARKGNAYVKKLLLIVVILSVAKLLWDAWPR